LSHLCTKTKNIYQDRLGTNIGKLKKERVAFFLRVLALVCHDWREGVAPVRGFRRLGM